MGQVPEPNAAGVAKPTPGGAGVANQDATNQPGTADVELREKLGQLEQSLESVTSKFEEDLRRQKSALQSSHAADIKQAQAQWEAERQQYVNQMRNLQLQAVDEDDREAYMRRFQQEDAQSLQQQLQNAVAELEAARQAPVNLQAAAKLGIDVTQVDVSSEDALYSSLWSGIGNTIAQQREQLADMQKQIEELKTPPAATTVTPATSQAPASSTPSTMSQPPVLTGQYSTPKGQATLEDVRKAVSAQSGREISLDEMFTIAEQRPDLEQRLHELTAGQE